MMATMWQIGDRIQNRWEVHRILGGPGKSGMGVVYVVYDRELREVFAAKTFQDEVFARNPAAADLFTKEAIAWVNLDAHQNVVQARMVHKIKGKPYLFLEYVSGGDLSRWIGTQRLTQDLHQVLRFAIQFCDGMTHALSKGIAVHRDIKPQNCLITKDKTLKVTDFGLAKVSDAASATERIPEEKVRRGVLGRVFEKRQKTGHRRVETPGVRPLGVVLTRTGIGMGTPTHMAPEQFDDAKAVDVRADIYSFGVMLFEMVTGRLPFVGRTREESKRLHKTQPPPSISDSLAHPLTTVLHTCLAKDPGDRFANFMEVRERLAEIYETLTGERAPQPAAGTDLKAEQWSNKGVSLSALGRYEEAFACYNRALELTPGLAGVWNVKGIDLYELGRFKEALACQDHALELDPRDWRSWTSKGLALEALGRVKEALQCYDHALELNPRDETAWSNKGSGLHKLRRIEEALACYDRALELNPHDEMDWTNKGGVLHSLGRTDEALDCFDHALQLNPYYDQAFYNKGCLLSALGRKEEALDCYDRAIKSNRSYQAAWYNKGAMLTDSGRLEEALDCFEHATTLDPRDSDAWLKKGALLANKGTVLANTRHLREALTCFEQAQRLGHPQAGQAIGLCREAFDK